MSGSLASALAALERGDFAAVARMWGVTPEVGRVPALRLIHALGLGGAGEVGRAGALLDGLAVAGHAHPRRDLADLLVKLGRHEEAAVQYGAAAAALPGDVKAWHGLGLSLASAGDFAGAEAAFRQAIALDCGSAAPWSNLGMVLKTQGRFDEAVAAHDEAVRRAPEDARVRVNRAVALLHAGRLTEAWRDYEYRLVLAERPALPAGRLLPGVEGLAGRTVLVWHEEGFGDTIQFARYAPMLAEHGARVMLAVPEVLRRLMGTLAGVEVVPIEADWPAYDFHCPVFSLPRAFGTTMASIPAKVPYLRAEPGLVARWGAGLPAGRRIGCVWTGQARPWAPGFDVLQARRSLDPAWFRGLAAPGVALISLQLGQAAPDFMANPMPGVRDFADTAAIIANLDVVVSVDTSVVHLAGALGRPVVLLDRFDNCWRWFRGREDSPWYPSLRILRQKRRGEWEEVMRRLQMRAPGGLEIGAGDEAAGIGAKEQGGADHFLGAAGAVHGIGALLDLFPRGGVLTAPAVALGGDQARGQGVQQDAAAGVFAGQVDDQVVLGGFQRGVDAEGVVGVRLVDAAEGKHAAPALLAHRGDGGL